MRRSFGWGATAAAVLLATVVVSAGYNHYFYLGGDWQTGTSVTGHANADPVWYGYPSGPTYVKVRLDGKGPASTCSTMRDGDWCADDANSNGFGGWNSHAYGHWNIIPIGCYTATIMVWVNSMLVENYPTGKCYEDPPPSLPGDGYCVSYDFDYSRGEYVCNTSPIVIDTRGKYADYKLGGRAYFDLNADGVKDYTNWTLPNSAVAFLAYDANGNGTIDDGSELFGSKTVSGANNGFAALRALGQTGESGTIDLQHGQALFVRLLLWHDRNGDATSQEDELTPAHEVLEAIGLGYERQRVADKNGNLLTWKGWARFRSNSFDKTANTLSAPAREFTIYDVNFGVPKK